MKPEIIEIEPRRLVGMRIRTTFAENRTADLWRAFRPRVGELLTTRVGTDFYSVQVYAGGLPAFSEPFERWAAVAVADAAAPPEGLETLTVPAGLYAVFRHRGTPADFPRTARFIFGEWLPASDFELDARPHFEVLGANYRPDDPAAEEDVCIPLRPRRGSVNPKIEK